MLFFLSTLALFACVSAQGYGGGNPAPVVAAPQQDSPRQCPVINPPSPSTPDCNWVPITDPGTGCTINFEQRCRSGVPLAATSEPCVDSPMPQPKPECTWKAVQSSRGCVTGYECVPAETASPVFAPTAAPVQPACVDAVRPAARPDCNHSPVTDSTGCVTRYDCTPIAVAAPVQPVAVPQAGPTQFGVQPGLPCPPVPATEPKPGCTQKEVLDSRGCVSMYSFICEPPGSGFNREQSPNMIAQSAQAVMNEPQAAAPMAQAAAPLTLAAAPIAQSPVAQPMSAAAPVAQMTQMTQMSPAGGDAHQYCCFWAGMGECDRNPFWMKVNCQRSCGTVGCSVDRAQSCPTVVNTAGCPYTGGQGGQPIMTAPVGGVVTGGVEGRHHGWWHHKHHHHHHHMHHQGGWGRPEGLPMSAPVMLPAAGSWSAPSMGFEAGFGAPTGGQFAEQGMMGQGEQWAQPGMMEQGAGFGEATGEQWAQPGMMGQGAGFGEATGGQFAEQGMMGQGAGFGEATGGQWAQPGMMGQGAGFGEVAGGQWAQQGMEHGMERGMDRGMERGMERGMDRAGCSDSHPLCGFWAGVGECQRNPAWMYPNCRAACRSC